MSGGFSSWLVGGIIDRRGARGVLTAAGVIMALCMVALSAVQQPWHFWIAFGVARGVAASGGQLPVTVSIASWFVRKRGRAVGVIGTGQRLGQAVLPLPIVAVIAALSWREAWLVLAGMVVLLLVVPSAVFMRRRPEDYGLLPDGEVPAEDSDVEVEVAAERIEETWTLREAKQSRALWLLMTAQASVVLCLNATNLHMTVHLQDSELSLALAATAATIVAVGATLTVLPLGLALERVHVRYMGLGTTAMLVVSMVLLVAVDSFAEAVLFAVVYGVAVGAWTVTSRMLYANYFGRRSFGSIRGFTAPIIVTANPLGPLLAGVIRDQRGSFDLAFSLFAVIFVVAFIAFLYATPPRKKVASP